MPAPGVFRRNTPPSFSVASGAFFSSAGCGFSGACFSSAFFSGFSSFAGSGFDAGLCSGAFAGLAGCVGSAFSAVASGFASGFGSGFSSWAGCLCESSAFAFFSGCGLGSVFASGAGRLSACCGFASVSALGFSGLGVMADPVDRSILPSTRGPAALGTSVLISSVLERFCLLAFLPVSLDVVKMSERVLVSLSLLYSLRRRSAASSPMRALGLVSSTSMSCFRRNSAAVLTPTLSSFAILLILIGIY